MVCLIFFLSYLKYLFDFISFIYYLFIYLFKYFEGIKRSLEN